MREQEFMKNWVTKSIVAGGLAVVVGVGLVGCATCKPGHPETFGRYNLEVALDESLKSSSVVVDLVGVNSSNLPRWEAYDMGKYWKDGDPMRQDADKVVLNFVSGQALSKSLATTDAQWDKWKSKGVLRVLVLADLPGTQTSRAGNQDARRQIISLDPCSWPDKTTNLKVLVQRSGIQILTSPRTGS
jgi:hypothetical protein